MIFFAIICILKILKDIVIIYFISQSVSTGKISFLLKDNNYIVYNLLCIYLTMLFIDLIVAQYDIAFLITITLFYILSLAMYYVHEFRGTNINLSDILSLNTAKEVAGGYKYKIKSVFVLVLLVIAYQYVKIFIIYNKYNIPFVVRNKNFYYYSYIWHYRLIRFFLLVVVYFILRLRISSLYYDYSLNAGENEGYIYNFFSSIPVFNSKKKKNNESFTSDILIKNNEDLINTCKNIGINIEDKPHIIVVMNESFGITQEKVKTNVEVTPYYDSLKGLTKGNLYVNTFGGGTANTEFEFLTGMTIGNYEYPVMPYNNFVKSDKYSLARYFDNIGYKTIAMHPYTATNYHRDKVYKRFGFDELIFYDDFKHRDTVRNFVSDKAFYEEVIDRFNDIKESDKKLFLFGITMQNHSGYSTFDGAEVKAQLDGYKEKESLDAYLSLMKISDDALKTLIEYFDKEKEHVIILFFGDHNASFGTDINKHIFGSNIEYECTDAYRTPFFIYDNKTKEDNFVEGVSANFLSLLLLDKAGLPYDEVHKILNTIYKDYPVYNYHKRRRRESGELSYIPSDSYMELERIYLEK